MSDNITGTFGTRRDADMVVERLVQELGVERTDIFVTAEGDDNTAGVEVAGSDDASGALSKDARNDGAHEGGVTVSVDINDDALVAKIRAAFEEFHPSTTVED